MMEPQRTKHAIQNTVSGLIYKAVSLLMPFVVRTIIIYKLGVEYLGLHTLFSAILQVLSLTELGFSSAIVFAMYKPISEGDSEKIRALLSFLKNVYRVIGLIILVVGSAIAPALPYFIQDANSIPADVNLYLLYFIYLFNTAVSYLMFAYKGLLLTAHQRSDIENYIYTAVNLLMYVAQIAVLFLFRNYYIYIIFLPVSTIVINIVRAIVVNRKYPDLKCAGKLSKEERKSIYRNIFALIGHKISYTVIMSISNIIISAYLGLETVGIYGNYYYIVSALIGIVGIFHSAITASIGNSLVTASVEKNYNDFIKITFLNVWIVGWMAICLLCLYQPFMRLWVGEERMFVGTSGFWSVILFVLLFYLWKFKDIVPTYKDAAGLWKADFFKPYAVIAASLILCLVLTPLIGINGALIAMITGVFVISMPWETHALFKIYFRRTEWKYYLRLAVYTAVIAVIGVLTYFVVGLLPEGGSGWFAYGWFALRALLCLVIPNVLIFLCSFMTPEFKGLMKTVGHVFRKKKGPAAQETENPEAKTDDVRQ